MSDLDRIRKILAKAESTTFPAEAASCRAKAKELQERHGIRDNEVRPPAPFPRQPIMAGWDGAIVTFTMSDGTVMVMRGVQRTHSAGSIFINSYNGNSTF